MDVLRGGGERAPQGAEVGVHERLLVGRNNVRECGKMRAPRGPAVGAQTAAQGDDTKPYFTVKLYKYSSQCPPPSAIAACFILRTAADTATHTSGMDAPSATSGDTGNPTVPAAAFVKYPKTPIE